MSGRDGTPTKDSQTCHARSSLSSAMLALTTAGKGEQEKERKEDSRDTEPWV